MVLLLYLGLAPLITSKSRIPRWKPLMLPITFPFSFHPKQLTLILIAYCSLLAFLDRNPIRYTGLRSFFSILRFSFSDLFASPAGKSTPTSMGRSTSAAAGDY